MSDATISDNESTSPRVSIGSDHQSLRLRAPSFGSGGGSGTLMSIIVLISVIFTILSATTTEVTIKGLGSLVFAILALTLGIRSWEISRKEANSGPRVKGQTILEPTTTRQSRNRTSLRLAIGGVATGAVLAIITAVLISIVLSQVLDRLS